MMTLATRPQNKKTGERATFVQLPYVNDDQLRRPGGEDSMRLSVSTKPMIFGIVLASGIT